MMGVFAEMVRGLLAAGATAETIIETVERAEASCLRFSIARTKEEKTEPKREEYPEDFAEFWNGYPDRAGTSKKEAYEQWKKISPEERKLAVEALPKFREYVEQQRKKNPQFTTVHACRYLSKRRGESLLEADIGQKVLAENAPVFVSEMDERWKALSARYKREKGKLPPVIQSESGQRGWHFAQTWFLNGEVIDG